MLELIGISKDYLSGADAVHALKKVNLAFSDNEFTSILGPSGCGKTTLLNIVGGLDRYTGGDLIIEGKSTKHFLDADWDAYRNKRIGFIFQNYNLIPHLNVLQNVELALTLAGITPSQRKERATKVLEEVGLSDKLNSKPNQLSGGQMQRVAIARALVNNPSVILADEPTGALDSTTSVQIIELLAKIAEKKLVIMVTHNSEIAEKYSTRIIKLFDGEVSGDTQPYTPQGLSKEEGDAKEQAPKHKASKANNILKRLYDKGAEIRFSLFKSKKKERTSMSYATAIGLSFRNLLTKKVRTSITAFAGSIGIVGVGLVLAISNGFTGYITGLEQGVMGTLPVAASEMSIRAENIWSLNPMDILSPDDVGLEAFSKDKTILSKETSASQDIIENIKEMVIFNNLSEEYVDYVSQMNPSYGSVEYMHALKMNLITKTHDDAFYFPKTADIFWQQLMGGESYIKKQYEFIAGRYPQNNYEAVVIVDKYNRLDEKILSALGLNSKSSTIVANDLLTSNIKLVYNDGFYVEKGGVYYDFPDAHNTSDAEYNIEMRRQLYNDNTKAKTITISGVMRIKEGMDFEMMVPGIAYVSGLVDDLLVFEKNSAVVQAQSISDVDVTTGKPFSLDISQNAIMSMDMNEYLKLAAKLFNTQGENTDYFKKAKLQELGGDDTPNTIYIYPESFRDKTLIKNYLDKFNDMQELEENKVIYIDMAEMATGMAGEIINIISIILVAFAAISLVVSSVMIGIITYVSVVERTKEIGVLRSIGARKLDISNVFNAETTIIGFTAGLIGVAVTYLLSVPINLIINHYAGLDANLAALKPVNALLLVVISVALTFIAGLFPARLAAKKDPVVALRTE
ncbi:MAG: ATP-binding cassette domain-containing protein [Clostridia bacterium]